MKLKYDIATPYTAVYIIFRKAGKIAFVLRSNTDWMNGYYGLPAGKVEKNESFLAAAVREAKEEVGVKIVPANLKHLMTAHRIEPDSIWVDIFFTPLTYGGELYNAEPHVHSELAWLDPKKLPGNIVPAVRFYIDHIEAGDTYCQYGWTTDEP